MKTVCLRLFLMQVKLSQRTNRYASSKTIFWQGNSRLPFKRLEYQFIHKVQFETISHFLSPHEPPPSMSLDRTADEDNLNLPNPTTSRELPWIYPKHFATLLNRNPSPWLWRNYIGGNWFISGSICYTVLNYFDCIYIHYQQCQWCNRKIRETRQKRQIVSQISACWVYTISQGPVYH